MGTRRQQKTKLGRQKWVQEDMPIKYTTIRELGDLQDMDRRRWKQSPSATLSLNREIYGILTAGDKSRSPSAGGKSRSPSAAGSSDPRIYDKETGELKTDSSLAATLLRNSTSNIRIINPPIEQYNTTSTVSGNLTGNTRFINRRKVRKLKQRPVV